MLDEAMVHARATDTLFGLAIGDALGAPADVHRSVRTPWVRGRLWAGSADLDLQRVSRPLLPFTPTLDNARGVSPTDDTEEAVAAARSLLAVQDADPDGRDTELFAQWLAFHAGEDAWLGVAARSAERNAAWGLTPPRTGNDNPAADDDAAVPAGISFGIAYAGDAVAAADAARSYARITHAGDGADAAAFAAVVVAMAVTGSAFETAVDVARRQIASGSWLAAGLATAQEIAREVTGGFDAIPALIDALSPRLYSHAGTAAETLPLAVAITMLAGGAAAQGIPLSLTISRKADSLPAFVGAFCGALGGGASIDRWSGLDAVQGHLLPAVAGQSLTAVAADLAGHAIRRSHIGPVSPGSEHR
ncbi:ADP-ribosylglycohydrolase family protein [Microbacterium sp. cx-55]|uniref:ADP-ribosylglycohydrolase family protein n=1 Tax=Microbacterium sp. cx-55 TaxID=2875948 RepID=UPI001CBD23A4|nr:ADP-ribosylglycohydrolase family protein [Microbacterium sp. cx-55]MBZ4488052.1 ADP-ribosylglycohydrolase family protein [Microbacterium sp. cx-55]UGB34542.1 ADP-ribosylglycohydrolase family protein [Microbacterium sp. cx-55]